MAEKRSKEISRSGVQFSPEALVGSVVKQPGYLRFAQDLIRFGALDVVEVGFDTGEFLNYLLHNGYAARGLDLRLPTWHSNAYVRGDAKDMVALFGEESLDAVIARGVFSLGATGVYLGTEIFEPPRIKVGCTQEQRSAWTRQAIQPRLEGMWGALRPGGHALIAEKDHETFAFTSEDTLAVGFIVDVFEPSYAILRK